MTREEAIRLLSGLMFKGKLKEALDMAIKTLEQEPTTKNDLAVDCISRESIKQKLQEHHDFFVNAYGGFSNLPQNDKSRVDEILNCIAMVVNEPPVTPQEPKIKERINSAWECGYDVGRGEQKSILNKIRAEIKAMSDDIETIADALAIIDKYKAESEDKE